MSQSLRFTFKLVFTSNVWELDVDRSMSTADFITWINSPEMLTTFNINNQYHIDVVQAGNYNYRQPELAPSILASFTETVGEKFNPQTTSFYLRPVHPITEFFRRNDYSIAPNYTRPDIEEPLSPNCTRPDITISEVLIFSNNDEQSLNETNEIL